MSRFIDGESVIKWLYRPYSNEESYSNIDIEKIINSQPSPCDKCMNNPKNGGNGICNCTLGTQTIY